MRIEDLFCVALYFGNILVLLCAASWGNKGEGVAVELRCREMEKKKVKNTPNVSFVLRTLFSRTKYPKKLP